jgi:inosine/xanthosine triphosphate pyrophosphatase family protein
MPSPFPDGEQGKHAHTWTVDRGRRDRRSRCHRRSHAVNERPLRLVAATRNPAKVANLSEIVRGIAIVEPLSLDITLAGEIEESTEAGEDLASIAAAKAVVWSKVLGSAGLVIATDGGLLAPALGARWNPAQTRRFAGPGVSDRERARRLLALAVGLAGAERRIGWKEAVAIARVDRLLAQLSAESEPGLLAETVDEAAIARGNGFWVPAIWRCPEFDGRLLADLTDDEAASRDDHWRRLREPIRAWLIDYRLRESRS